jgi:hypothetical protein
MLKSPGDLYSKLSQASPYFTMVLAGFERINFGEVLTRPENYCLPDAHIMAFSRA